MIGFNVSEAGHVVNVIPPVDGNAGAPVTAQGFHMKGHAHASIIVQIGVSAAAATSIILVSSTAVTAGTTTQLPFRYYSQTTAGKSNDVVTGPTIAVAATGIATPTAADGVFYVIELDAAELPDGQPYLQLQVTCAASGFLLSAVAILSGARNAYQGSATITA